MVSRSPWPSCFSWIDSPFTNVPFVLPRSTTQNCSPRRSSRAWCPLVAGSRRITSLSGERPMRRAWSPARWVCPASGPVSIVSSACGPVPAAAGGRVGIAIVSGTEGGAEGGGCQAGMSVVGSRSAPPKPGGGAAIVAATSIPAGGADHGAAAGSLHAGAGADWPGLAGASQDGATVGGDDVDAACGAPQSLLVGAGGAAGAGGFHEGAEGTAGCAAGSGGGGAPQEGAGPD